MAPLAWMPAFAGMTHVLSGIGIQFLKRKNFLFANFTNILSPQTDAPAGRRIWGPGFMSEYYVYILASKRNGTLYIGVTNDLVRRIYEHKHNLVEGFTKRHNVHELVYYEQGEDIYEAISREKQLKAWQRKWKIELIEKSNPQWKDLFKEFSEE